MPGDIYYWDLFQQPIALLQQQDAGDALIDAGLADGPVFGGVHHRFKRGYKNVINEAIRLNAAGEYTPLAIETSGHAALKENYFLDDGAYLITRLLIALAKAAKQGKNLSALIADLKMPAEAAELHRLVNDQGAVGLLDGLHDGLGVQGH